jgi:hypothetical protein
MTAMRQRTTVGRRSGRRRAPGEPVRREVAPALPLGGEADVPADGTAEVEAPVSEAPVTPQPIETVVDEPVEAPGGERVDIVDAVENVEHVEAVEAVEAVEETDGVDAELEPAGAETPPLDEEWTEPLDETPTDDGVEVVGAEDELHEVDAAPTAKRAAASRRKQRPSVPSWDDIMFGTKRD